MRPQVRAFRNAVSQAAQLKSIHFRVFMEDGLEDILEKAEMENWSAKQIANQFLARCCATAETDNYFKTGFLAVVIFLKDQLGPLCQGEQQALFDLSQILKRPNSLQGIEGWLNTHYP